MGTNCIMCQTGLTGSEINRSAGLLCTSCMISIQGQAKCFICKEYFTLENLYVTIREGESVDICKPCSLNANVAKNFTDEITTHTYSLENIAIQHPEEWHSEDGVTWKSNIPTTVPIKTTWNTPRVISSQTTEIDTPMEDPLPIIEFKPRRLKIKDSK